MNLPKSAGEPANALQVIAFDTAEGWSQDVSEDIVSELLERAIDGLRR
jgi:hypothetical protein